MCREFLSPSALKRVIENSHVVYHGIHCDEIEEVGKRTPKAEKFTLLYSGRLTSNKQWKKVLLDYKKFFSFGRDLDLVVCAPLGSTEVDRALKILGTWGEVNLGLPRKDYLEKLVSSHVCLSNSLEEGGTVGFCYDDQTEILTEKGWKKFSDLRKEDKVLTMNPINSLAEFKKPDKFFKIDFDGYLYEYEEKTINFAVTPGHKMFVRKGGKNEYELMSIEDVIKYKNVFVTSVMFWKGKVREFFYLPIYRKEWVTKGFCSGKRVFCSERKKIKMSAWLEFLGWFLSEGCCGSRSVEITQKDKNKINKIAKIVERCGFKYKINTIPNGCSRVRINSIQLVNWLKRNCYLGNPRKAFNKKVPRFIFKLNPFQIELFLNNFWLGDGRKHMGGRDFISSSRQLADDLQILILLCGKKATINKYFCQSIFPGGYINKSQSYIVYENKSYQSLLITDRIKKKRYTGKVYCVSVPPFRTIMVRRNGKPMWCGNCEQLYSGSVVILPRRPWVEGLLGPMYKDYPFLYDGTTEEAYTVLKAVYEDYQSAREKMEPVRRFIRENYDIKVVTKRYFDIMEDYILERKRRVVRKREPQGIKRLIDNILRIMGKEVSFLEFLERTKLYSEKDVKVSEKNWRSGFPSRWQMYQFLVKRGYRDNYLFENPILVREKNGESSKDKRVLSKKAEGDGVILYDQRLADGEVQEHDLTPEF